MLHFNKAENAERIQRIADLERRLAELETDKKSLAQALQIKDKECQRLEKDARCAETVVTRVYVLFNILVFRLDLTCRHELREET